jgi:hypothetical protein
MCRHHASQSILRTVRPHHLQRRCDVTRSHTGRTMICHPTPSSDP